MNFFPISEPTLCDCEDIVDDFKSIIKSKVITNAKFVSDFEEKLKKYIGCKHVICVSSATSGLILSIKGLNLTNEVIVPSFTFTATVNSLIWNNITPVLVDCNKETFNIDVKKIEKAITEKTTAIMPVYVFGNPPDIDALVRIANKYNLKLIFDSAQGLGAKYNGTFAGNFGDCEVFSLSPTKILTAVEGGIVTTNCDKLANFVHQSRDYGKNYLTNDVDFVGFNARMSEFHALIGIKNLKNFSSFLSKRKDFVNFYKKSLDSIPGISFQKINENSRSSWNYFCVLINKNKFGMTRDELGTFLKDNNIITKKYFYPPIHRLSAFNQLVKYSFDNLTITEKIAHESLALPLYSHMNKSTINIICNLIKEAYEKH